MVEINITILFQFVNFMLGLLIINYFIIKPLREVMAKRRALLDGLGTESSNFENSAKKKLDEYEESLKKARESVAVERNEFMAVAGAKAQDIQEKATQEARKIRQDAENIKQTEGEKVYKELNSQASNFAQSFIQRILS